MRNDDGLNGWMSEPKKKDGMQMSWLDVDLRPAILKFEKKNFSTRKTENWVEGEAGADEEEEKRMASWTDKSIEIIQRKQNRNNCSLWESTSVSS